MSVYSYSERHIEERVNRARRIRFWFVVVVSLVFAAVCLLYFYSPGSPILRIPIWGPLLGIVITLFLPWNWRAWPENLRKSLGQTSIEISAGSVAMSGPQGFKREFSSGEIVLTEEPSLGTGLYLRTSNRYRWIAIPRRLAGYEAIKQELGAVGFSVVRTTIPPNWEEFAGMLLFAGTVICSFAVHNIRALSVNLLVALLLSVGWFFVINANPDVLKLPQMRWARFGAFLPVVFAAAGLWSALHD
ncbi:MAG: hypothetical protein JWN74_2133 [Acidobacteriaceae bacterium]|nr:hypothetical protein [Acidobacteriaceae bacterium]